MTRVTSARPEYPRNEDFTTDFETEQGPGFFPGAAGYFHGCSSCSCAPKIVVFGTDFGTEEDWRDKVQGKGGEKRTQPTLCPLRCLIDAVQADTGVRDLACWFYLTNAVLALAKVTDAVRNNTDTYKAYRKPEHGLYLRQCGETHREWLKKHTPGLAVLIGARHLKNYGPGLWAVVWPELFGPGGRWDGLDMKNALRNRVETTESGLRVQLMYHPSSRQHWWSDLDETQKTLQREVKRLAE